MIGGFQVGPFQTNYQQQATKPIIVGSQPSGVGGRKYRVRRSDFTNDETYQLALRAALNNANFAVRKFDDVELVIAPIAAKSKVQARIAVVENMSKADVFNEMELLQIWMVLDE